MGIVADVGAWKAQRAAGKIARYESQVQAKQEELAAVAREADRKAKLTEALASQNASAAAGGVVAFEGSPLAVIKEDIRLAKQDSRRDAFQSSLARKTYIARGKIAETQAKTAANIGLIRAIESKAASAQGASGG